MWDYKDMLPTKFSEIKWVDPSIGEMHIELKEGEKPIKKNSYILKSNLKAKVKFKLDWMIEECLINPI